MTMMKCAMTTESSVLTSTSTSASNQEMKRESRGDFRCVGELTVPENFIWPDEFKASDSVPELHVPHIDLKKFLSGKESDVEEAMQLVDEACKKHGFFVVVNHGIDMVVMEDVHKCMDEFFPLPLDFKLKARRIVGENYGYINSFIGRYSSNLTWKETFSVRCLADGYSSTAHDYVCETLGQDFSHHGKAYQKCGKEMSELCLNIMELLGLSLGIGREEFKKFYEDNDSILRLNYYPTCEKPELTFGQGPHCDPTSITILHQDHVRGLQAYVDDQWHSIPPTKDSFVVNIGDTFMSLTNGVYKSCFHRAVVNSNETRKSVGFFLCPKASKLVRAPEELVEKYPPRKFRDYTWSMLDEFTQKIYRPDSNTLQAFEAWLQHKNLDTNSSATAPSL